MGELPPLIDISNFDMFSLGMELVAYHEIKSKRISTTKC